jgi:hypothetical protein
MKSGKNCNLCFLFQGFFNDYIVMSSKDICHIPTQFQLKRSNHTSSRKLNFKRIPSQIGSFKLSGKIKLPSKRKEKKELKERLKKLNLDRKRYRKYLICMHIFKTGILKLSYYIISNIRKSMKNTSLTIILPTAKISSLKNPFTASSLTT